MTIQNRRLIYFELNYFRSFLCILYDGMISFQSSAIPVGKMKSKSALGIPGKNPVSVLNEYAQKSCTKLRFESSQTGPPHKPV